MRKTLLSIALSAGLVVGTVGSAFAQGSTMLEQACVAFVNDMGQRWSGEGYSSLENALYIEGGDWFRHDCVGSGALAQVTGTNNVSHDPLRGQAAQATNLIEANGIALGGTFGSGHLEDDESNGRVNTGNDVQGGKNGGKEDD